MLYQSDRSVRLLSLLNSHASAPSVRAGLSRPESIILKAHHRKRHRIKTTNLESGLTCWNQSASQAELLATPFGQPWTWIVIANSTQ